MAAILKKISESGVSGPPVQIVESTKIAQLARQIRNMRKVIFSVILVITPCVSTGFRLFENRYDSNVVSTVRHAMLK